MIREIDKSLDDERIIVGKSSDATAAFAITPKQMAVVVKMLTQKFCRAHCAFEIARFVQHLRAARKRRNHQPIPRRDDFVIEMRTRPFVSDRQ